MQECTIKTTRSDHLSSPLQEIYRLWAVYTVLILQK